LPYYVWLRLPRYRLPITNSGCYPIPVYVLAFARRSHRAIAVEQTVAFTRIYFRCGYCGRLLFYDAFCLFLTLRRLPPHPTPVCDATFHVGCVYRRLPVWTYPLRLGVAFTLLRRWNRYPPHALCTRIHGRCLPHLSPAYTPFAPCPHLPYPRDCPFAHHIRVDDTFCRGLRLRGWFFKFYLQVAVVEHTAAANDALRPHSPRWLRYPGRTIYASVVSGLPARRYTPPRWFRRTRLRSAAFPRRAVACARTHTYLPRCYRYPTTRVRTRCRTFYAATRVAFCCIATFCSLLRCYKRVPHQRRLLYRALHGYAYDHRLYPPVYWPYCLPLSTPPASLPATVSCAPHARLDVPYRPAG